MKQLFPALGALTVLALAVPAAAQTSIGNAGYGSASVSQTSSAWIGQTFTVPPGVERLTEVQLGVSSSNPNPTFTISLHRWTAGSPGPEIAVDSTPTPPAPPPAYSMLSLSPVDGLPVTPGDVYLIRLNTSDTSVAVPLAAWRYPEGSMTDDSGWSQSLGQDAYFTATFTSTVPAPIPTLSEWAMIALGTVLAGGTALTIQQRHKTA